MKNNNQFGVPGIRFLGLMLVSLLFSVLKLCGILKLSWWWVLAPIWLSAILSFIVILGVCITLLITRPKGK